MEGTEVGAVKVFSKCCQKYSYVFNLLIRVEIGSEMSMIGCTLIPQMGNPVKKMMRC